MLTLLAQKVDIRGNLGPNVQFDAGKLVSRFAGVGLLIAALATFGYILLGGIHWVLAAGDKGKIETARSMITQGLIGITITAGTFALFGVVNYFFGLGINITGIN
ncbi:MAG: hypothetical protein AAB612_01530 [Patescibacteria group bacterium]